MSTLSRARLYELLDERIRDPSVAKDQEREIWERCGADRAIVVIDLSGFTRVTRTRGILTFLTVYRRATRILLPLIAERGGRVVKCEADNVLASFQTAKGAVAASLGIVEAAAATSEGLPEDERVKPCVAVGFGRVLELEDDFFGDEVNVTFKLGEDVTRSGEVLRTEGAWDRLRLEGERAGGDPLEIALGGVVVRYFRHRR
jgi:adenylate cyclase